MTTLEDLLFESRVGAEEPFDFFVEAARSIATNLGLEETLPCDEETIPAWVYADDYLFVGAAKYSSQTWIGVRVPDAETGDAWTAVLDVSGLKTIETFQPLVGPLLSSRFWTDYLKRKLQEVDEPDWDFDPIAEDFLTQLSGAPVDLQPLLRQLRYLSRSTHTRITARWCLQLIKQLSALNPEVMEQILEAIDDDATSP